MKLSSKIGSVEKESLTDIEISEFIGFEFCGANQFIIDQLKEHGYVVYYGNKYMLTDVD